MMRIRFLLVGLLARTAFSAGCQGDLLTDCQFSCAPAGYSGGTDPANGECPQRVIDTELNEEVSYFDGNVGLMLADTCDPNIGLLEDQDRLISVWVKRNIGDDSFPIFQTMGDEKPLQDSCVDTNSLVNSHWRKPDCTLMWIRGGAFGMNIFRQGENIMSSSDTRGLDQNQDGTCELTPGTWHHFALGLCHSHYCNHMTAYCDGVPIRTIDHTQGGTFQEMVIGISHWQNMKGFMTKFQIFDGGKDDATVLAMFNQGPKKGPAFLEKCPASVCGATPSPTKIPTKSPSDSPTESPTLSPTKFPTKSPSDSPTESPTKAPKCSDLALNGDESDVDCGGACPPCATGMVCRTPQDCSTDLCVSETPDLKKCQEQEPKKSAALGAGEMAGAGLGALAGLLGICYTIYQWYQSSKAAKKTSKLDELRTKQEELKLKDLERRLSKHDLEGDVPTAAASAAVAVDDVEATLDDLDVRSSAEDPEI